MSTEIKLDTLAERAVNALHTARTDAERAAAQTVIADIHELAEQVRADQTAADTARAQRKLDAGDDLDRAAHNLSGFGYGTTAALTDLRDLNRAKHAADADRADWMVKRQAPDLWRAMTGEQVNMADDPRNRETHTGGNS